MAIEMTRESRDVLDRALTTAAMQEAAVIGSELMRELVNYGTAVLSRCKHHLGPLPPKPEDRALLVLLRQILESMDVLQILAEAGTLAGADPALRAALEAFFSISYIVGGSSSERERRGRAYMLVVLRQQLSDIRSRQPGTPENAELLRAVKGDIYAEAFVPVPDEADTQHIARINGELESEEFAAVRKAYDELAAKRKWAKWYEIDDGPRTIKRMAEVIGQSGVYAVLYSAWSATVHAQDVAPPGDDNWLRLRTTAPCKVAVPIAVWIAVEAIRLVLSTYRPDDWDDMVAWYNNEIRPRRDALVAVDVIDLPTQAN